MVVKEEAKVVDTEDEDKGKGMDDESLILGTTRALLQERKYAIMKKRRERRWARRSFAYGGEPVYMRVSFNFIFDSVLIFVETPFPFLNFSCFQVFGNDGDTTQRRFRNGSELARPLKVYTGRLIKRIQSESVLRVRSQDIQGSILLPTHLLHSSLSFSKKLKSKKSKKTDV